MSWVLTYGFVSPRQTKVILSRGGGRRTDIDLSFSRHPQTNVYAHIVNENALVDGEYFVDSEVQDILLQTTPVKDRLNLTRSSYPR
ncbi:hypothetical protein VTO73DRAFT_4406 [Trametes versicolor]